MTGAILAALGVCLAFAVVALRLLPMERPVEREAREYLVRAQVDHAQLKRNAAQFQLQDYQPSTRDADLAELGRSLFFDARLSRNGAVSCATCHQPERSFTDGLPTAVGLAKTQRNSPTIVNTFAAFWFFWDGRADSLAAQAIRPFEDPKEHGITRTHIARHVMLHYLDQYETLFGRVPGVLRADLPRSAKPNREHAELSDEVVDAALTSIGSRQALQTLADDAARSGTDIRDAFRRRHTPAPDVLDADAVAFARLDEETRQAINRLAANVGLAIEAFEKGIVANRSPFDDFLSRWLSSANADPEGSLDVAFGAQQYLGFDLFMTKGACAVCHTGSIFSDSQFHNLALPSNGEELAIGRSLGLALTVRDEFNCLGSYGTFPERQVSESCKDMRFLNFTTPEGIGSFKTPTLRNVAETAPYMHDGSMTSLREVLEHYNQMNTSSVIGNRDETLKPLGLDETELLALEAFLQSLTSPIRDLNRPVTAR